MPKHSLLQRLLLGAALACGLASALPAADALPVDRWTVEAPADSSARLSETDGVLRIDLTAKAEENFQSGCNAFRQAVIKLLLKEPVAVGPEFRRVSFEATGIKDSRRGAEKIALMPLIRDEQGELLAYAPHPQEHLKSGSDKWSGWITRDFYSSEAGGASQDVFTPLTAGGNAWPDGKLTLLGFAVTFRSDKPAEYTGVLQLANWAMSPLTTPVRDPSVFADALFEKAGTYRLGYQISRDFQSLPVREEVRDITFDPARPSSARQKIVFPLGPDDNYWIRYSIYTPGGEIVDTQQLRAWVEGRTDTSLPAPLGPDTPPAFGCLRINPSHAGRGVYEQNEPLKVTVRAFAQNNQPYTVKWTLREYAFPQTLQSGEAEIAGTAAQDVALELKLPDNQDAARLTAEAVREGKVIDRQEYVLGRKTDFSKPYTGRNGAPINRAQIKQSAYFRVSYLPMKNNKDIPYSSAEEYVARFRAALPQIAQLTTNVTFMIDLVQFEILPGVFDFRLLDEVMDAAYDQNCRLTIRLSHADRSGIYNWQHYWPQRSYDRNADLGHSYYGNFSLSYRPYVNNFLDGFRALHTRYQKHPAFQGYQLFEVSGEWAVLDQPWAGIIACYEKPAREQFRVWTKENVTPDLAALNARWGTNFADWDAVEPPLPTLEQGAKPDLRLWWLDFSKFKLFLDNSYWFQTAAKSIRTHDKDGVLIIYSLDPEGFDDPAQLTSIDYLHNGGNHFLRGEGSLFDAWKSGIGWITEPHHPHRWAAYGDKDNRGWLLDWTTYVMLAQAGGGGANLHVYYWPLGGKEDLFLPAHYGREYAYDRFEKFKPILRELHGLRVNQPKVEVAVMQDIYTLFCKHRTVFQQRMDDLKRWFELLKNDAVDFENYRPAHAADYKLIVPNLLDEVMSEENIKNVAAVVRKGGKTVLGATTGRYCPERAGTDFTLLRELGITPPATAYNTTTAGVSAKVEGANPFFESGETVSFYSLTDMQKYLSGAEVAKTFWYWPYRWIPQTDYFGYFPGHADPGGTVLARFADGGAAVSLHKVGEGEALVFWGTPDYGSAKMKGFMAKVCAWAGVQTPRASNPVPLTIEGDHAQLNRHYAILYQDKPGAYTQKLPNVPAGEYFIDELVTSDRLGVYKAEELHAGLTLKWEAGESPLKILRMIPRKEMDSRWSNLYRLPAGDPAAEKK